MFVGLGNNYKAIILAIIGFGAFSISDSCTKWLTEYYSVFQIIGIKAVFVITMALCLSPWLGGLKRTLRTKKRTVHLLRGLINTILGVTVTVSFSKLPLAQAYTLFFVAPLLTTLLAVPIFKERIDWHGAVAIVFGFIGVLVVLRPGFDTFNPWLFSALLSSVFIALLFLLAKALNSHETLLSLPLFPVASDLIIMLPFVWPVLFILNPDHIPAFALSAFMIIVGFIGTSVAFRMANSAIVGPFHYTQIIWAILLGYFIFGDLPDLWTLLGGSIIIGSGIYLIETERRKR